MRRHGDFQEVLLENFIVNARLGMVRCFLPHTKTDSSDNQQFATLPIEDGNSMSPWSLLQQEMNRAAIRFGKLPEGRQRKLAARLLEDTAEHHRVAPSTFLEGFPVQLLEPMKKAGVLIHRLPLMGSWLLKEKLTRSMMLQDKVGYKPCLRTFHGLCLKAGLDSGEGGFRLGLHSCRRGGIQEARDLQISRDLIMAGSGHTSDRGMRPYECPPMLAQQLMTQLVARKDPGVLHMWDQGV
jgi:hypothetical protein